MIRKVFTGSLLGALCAITFYALIAPVLYSIIRVPLFSTDAWKASLFILVGVFTYYLSAVSFNKDNRALSPDKNKALYHSPSKEYLSTKPDGLTIGRFRNMYVRIPFLKSPLNQLIIGAPGDNKSTTIMNGIIYQLNFEEVEKRVHSMLVIDVKSELSRKCVLKDRSDIRIINPSDEHSCGFDIYFGLSKSSNDDTLYDHFSSIANTIVKDSGSDNMFFTESARNILTAFLMYGFVVGKSFGNCIEEIIGSSVADLIAQILADPSMNTHKRIKGLVREFDNKSTDAFEDVAMTLKKDLAIFDTTTVKKFFAPNTPKRVSPDDLLNGISVFLSIPEHLFEQYAPVFCLIINLCMSHIMAQDEAHKRNEQPIWFVVDEAGSIGRIPMLNTVLARGRSKGIQCTLIIQSDAQLDSAYGSNEARIIRDCCRNTIVFGSNDVPTCESLSKRTGLFTEARTSTTTRGGSMTGDSSRNESNEYRPAVDVADIQNLSRKKKALIFANGDWFICNKAPFYTVPMLHKKSIEIEHLNGAFEGNNASD